MLRTQRFSGFERRVVRGTTVAAFAHQHRGPSRLNHDGPGVSLRELPKRCGDAKGAAPAIAGLTGVLYGLWTIDASSRSFTNVHKQERWIREDPPFGLVRATFFSSGDRIRTCDLWVMS